MTTEETIEAWITKYALTQGIKKLPVKRSEKFPDVVTHKPENRFTEYFHKGQWHLDYEAAVAKAEDARKRRIASLKKQIKRLEALRFDEGMEN